MKKIKDKEFYIKIQRKREKHNLKRKLKGKKKQKQIRQLLQNKDENTRKNLVKIIGEYGDNRVKAPKNFSLLKNTEETIKFLQRINSLWEKRKKVYVVLRDVEEIDHSSTTVLLSLVHRFRVEGIKFNGDFPKNKEANKLIVESQFFERLLQLEKSPSSRDYAIKRDNQIIGEAGTQTIDSKTALGIREDVSQTITSSSDYVFPTLHPMFMELMQNTYEHAGEDEGVVNWWLSINHDKKNKKVSFHFIDYGYGIIDSIFKKENSRIKKAFKQLAWSLFSNGQFSNIILQLLNNEHRESKVDDYFRGKGIPSLKKAFDNKRIKCLNIITNKAVVDVYSGSAVDLKTDFTGTYITWTLDDECEKKIWQI